MKRIVGTIILVAALSGCQTIDRRLSTLAPGSRPDRVVAVLGRPDAIRLEDKYEIYTYRARRTFRSPHRVDYTVLFVRGHLVGFGPGLAKQIWPGDLVVVPPPLGIP